MWYHWTDFVMLLIVALLAVVAWLLLGSRLLVVRSVEVIGTDRLDSDSVAAAVDVPTGTPLARVDTDEAAGRASELRLVESAEVTRGWPATLHVRITERTPRLSIKVGDGYRLVDHDGIRIADSSTRPQRYPLISITGEAEGNAAIAEAASITDGMPDAVLGKVDAIDAADPSDITLILDDGASVAWGDSERTKEKSDILTILMEEHSTGAERHYDVSAAGMAVVK